MKIWKAVLSIGVLGTTWQAGLLPLFAAESGDVPASVNPLTVDPDLAILTAVVFVLLLLFLSKFAWRPLMEGLDKRERSIADMIQQAKQGAEEAAEKLEAYEAKLAAATEEAEGILAQTRREAAETRQQLLAEAHAEADRQRQRALDDIEMAKDNALQEIARKSADMAFTLARKLIQREVKPEDHATLIREAIDQFPSKN